LWLAVRARKASHFHTKYHLTGKWIAIEILYSDVCSLITFLEIFLQQGMCIFVDNRKEKEHQNTRQ
jgi:hypothetical protein